MCATCVRNSAILLSAMLASLPADAEADPRRQAQVKEMAGDAKTVLDIVTPHIQEDGGHDEAAADVSAAQLSDLLVTMGVRRIGNTIRFCGFLSNALDEVNRVGVMAISAEAKNGNLNALAWLLENAQGLNAEVIQVHTQERPAGRPAKGAQLS